MATQSKSKERERPDDAEKTEAVELVLFHVSECYVYLIPRGRQQLPIGEPYARAFLRNGEPHPVEPVIDSSRYFVLQVEENIGGWLRHAFIGIGFRERSEAYDFHAALHDHVNYLNKKKAAEEMEQHYQHSSSVDYNLKEGEGRPQCSRLRMKALDT